MLSPQTLPVFTATSIWDAERTGGSFITANANFGVNFVSFLIKMVIFYLIGHLESDDKVSFENP